MFKKLIILAVLFFVGVPAFAQSVDTAWVRRYNGPANGPDVALAIAIDNSGNIYVTGISYVTSFDYATIKYYSNGDTAWVRRYNGTGNGTDIAYALAVGSSDNIYVTGWSYGSGTSSDYATIKYYPDGDTAWVRRYNGPGNSGDAGRSVAVDGSGNVYVTGSSYGIVTSVDYATIKYYPEGDTAWVRRYNGPGDSTDYANALTIDGSGNVYVTGYSYDSGTDCDYATIKYYPNGDTAWVRRYNGPGDSTDCANALTIDGSGNVYVTGYSYDSGTDYDYATIKYYPNGDTAWVRRYNGPESGYDAATAITIDKSSNVYVTGQSNAHYTTIKYYPNGDTAWVRRYNKEGQVIFYCDTPNAIAVDGHSNVYVTGYSCDSVSYHDYATIKYNSNGETIWVKRYDGPGDMNHTDEAQAMAVDSSGSVYVTGRSDGIQTNVDYATIKYIELLDANLSGSPKAGYKPLSVQFNDLSTGNPTSWHWDFGDGVTGTVKNPMHIYSDTGHFDVKLVVSDGEYTDTTIKPNYIGVYDTLKVDFTAEPTHGRKPLSVSFQANCNVMPELIFWYFGDGGASSELNPVYEYTGSGNYDVKLLVELFGRYDSLIKEDYIRVSDIKADFTANKRCGSVPLTVTFSDNSTGTFPATSWHWDFGDEGTSDLQNPIHQFQNEGVFDVTLTVSDGIGPDSLTKKNYIILQDTVAANFMGLPHSGRPPLTVMFEPILQGIANLFFWNFGDGDTSSLRNPIHTYTAQGKYDVKLKVSLEMDDCNQVDSIIKEDYVIINDLQTKFSANPTAGVIPLVVQFTDSSSGNPDTWFWNFGDGKTSTEKNPQHQYDSAGAYDVFLRVSSYLGTDSLLKLKYIYADTPYSDLVAAISGWQARPGFDITYYFYWTNKGTNPSQNSVLKILLPPEMIFYDLYPGQISTGTYSGYSQSGDTIIVPLLTINPSGYYGGYVYAHGKIPENSPVHQIINCQMWLISPTAERNYDNNYRLHLQEVGGSWDPNDKLASPEGEGATHDINPDQRLEYTIQFENKAEATAEAIYIRVVDTLSQNLDWGTLAIGPSSHPNKCKFEFNPYSGVMEWFCDSIMLPPNVNPPEGEGYFTYSISPKKKLPNETKIANSAWIRFDYNDWLQAPEAGPLVRTIKYPFIRGDVNGDGKWTVADAVYLINYLFKGGPSPVPTLQAGDCNCDSKVTVGDVVYLINYLFKGGPLPCS